MRQKRIILKRGKEESLLRFHPWIFSGAIDSIQGEPDEGDLVDVYTSAGDWIAAGHIQIGSIAVRVLTFDRIPVDGEFWKQRLGTAFAVRRALGLVDRKDHNIYRLVHGEGDNLPGLVIDIYGRTAVMQAHSVGMHVDRYAVAEALTGIMGDRISGIYYKSETTLPFKADIERTNGYIKGGPSDDTPLEYGLRMPVDWISGQKTGLFIDQRENRALLERFSEGRSVLNMFCYTGGFSLAALRGGAVLVHSVDSSARAVELTVNGVRDNFPDDTRHSAFARDAFRFLDEMEPRYDLIVLDPPAFAKHKDALKHALIGYRRLNQKAFEKILPGGILFTFSCSQVVTKEQFRMAVFTAAAAAGRNVRILYQLHQPADHPVNIFHPEGEYLKGLVLAVD
ncbi:MAG: class I SAM-dependent rRNA methyltransferase [Bacteroidaceae bacterium]|nr:class I SAM-dependent rRNA methyltransferase [Bacteroidaceae bacterium]MBO7588448.1 class I SAM-dependent rRNA methyltransferase [Bacteroidaceae bacterium]MBP5646347.1 class I SAM-dependent rRNA methyltransferase [Bacteroidaceae bacterium]